MIYGSTFNNINRKQLGYMHTYPASNKVITFSASTIWNEVKNKQLLFSLSIPYANIVRASQPLDKSSGIIKMNCNLPAFGFCF